MPSGTVASGDGTSNLSGPSVVVPGPVEPTLVVPGAVVSVVAEVPGVVVADVPGIVVSVVAVVPGTVVAVVPGLEGSVELVGVSPVVVVPAPELLPVSPLPPSVRSPQATGAANNSPPTITSSRMTRC